MCVFACQRILGSTVIVYHCRLCVMLGLLTVCLWLAKEDGACSGVVRRVRLQGQIWENKKNLQVLHTLWVILLSLSVMKKYYKPISQQNGPDTNMK